MKLLSKLLFWLSILSVVVILIAVIKILIDTSQVGGRPSAISGQLIFFGSIAYVVFRFLGYKVRKRLLNDSLKP